MTSIEDPLAKPVWPSVDGSLQDAALNLLIAPCSRGTSDHVKIGFNNTMDAIEKHMAGDQNVETLFVARSDLNPAECLPLALASAAAQIRLVTLPKGSRSQLNGEGVIALCAGAQETQLMTLVNSVGPAKLDWVYQSATAVKRKKKVQKAA